MRNWIIVAFLSFFIFSTFFVGQSQIQSKNYSLTEDYQKECFEKISKDEFKHQRKISGQDTMSIDNLKIFWYFFRDDNEAEFAISSSKATDELNYGIFWPTGETIFLPSNSLSAPSLDFVDERLMLFWVEKDGEDLNLFYLPAPSAIDTLNLPRKIEISVF
ncbi:hypothetical protein K9M50_03265 [Patescibacteria group bacterium]|nr:hypothetical protein [Patescibacteria group bacterium]